MLQTRHYFACGLTLLSNPIPAAHGLDTGTRTSLPQSTAAARASSSLWLAAWHIQRCAALMKWPGPPRANGRFWSVRRVDFCYQCSILRSLKHSIFFLFSELFKMSNIILFRRIVSHSYSNQLSEWPKEFGPACTRLAVHRWRDWSIPLNSCETWYSDVVILSNDTF